jgi:chemotaxis response regulator CheB
LSITVLIADDSDVMRKAIRKTLEEEHRISVVGEASTFAQTIQMIADFKPEVLLLDLHLAEKLDFAPHSVKSQLNSVNHVLTVSFSNDDEAKAVAESYGSKVLLDKMNLYHDLASRRLC